MKRSNFLLISALLSFVFGTMLFFIPQIGAKAFGMTFTPQIGALLRGMGGLIIGSAAINFLLRYIVEPAALKALFLTNIITHIFGIAADFWGLYDGALRLSNILPVQITHLFIGGGSLLYLLRLQKAEGHRDRLTTK